MRATSFVSCVARVAIASVVLGACDRTGRTSATGGGPRIVENTAPRLGGTATWPIDSAPFRIIGAGAPRGARNADVYALHGVVGAALLRNGTLLIADRTSEVSAFDSTGTYTRLVGKTGDGPAEFRSITLVARVPGDTIVVADETQRISVYSPLGEYVRAFMTPGLSVVAAFSPSTVAERSMTGGFVAVVDTGKPGPRPAFADYVVADDKANRKPVGRFTISNLFRGDKGFGVFAFSGRARDAADSNTLYHGTGDRYEISAFDANGAPKLVIRRAWTPVPVTETDRKHFADAFMVDPNTGKPLAGPAAVEMKSLVPNIGFADHLTAYSDLRVDAAGNLWVENTRPESGLQNINTFAIGDAPTWSIFSSAGDWLLDVRTPRGLKVLEIGADYVLGLYRDANGVESVRAYRLHRS